MEVILYFILYFIESKYFLSFNMVWSNTLSNLLPMVDMVFLNIYVRSVHRVYTAVIGNVKKLIPDLNFCTLYNNAVWTRLCLYWGIEGIFVNRFYLWNGVNFPLFLRHVCISPLQVASLDTCANCRRVVFEIKFFLSLKLMHVSKH